MYRLLFLLSFLISSAWLLAVRANRAGLNALRGIKLGFETESSVVTYFRERSNVRDLVTTETTHVDANQDIIWELLSGPCAGWCLSAQVKSGDDNYGSVTANFGEMNLFQTLLGGIPGLGLTSDQRYSLFESEEAVNYWSQPAQSQVVTDLEDHYKEFDGCCAFLFIVYYKDKGYFIIDPCEVVYNFRHLLNTQQQREFIFELSRPHHIRLSVPTMSQPFRWRPSKTVSEQSLNVLENGSYFFSTLEAAEEHLFGRLFRDACSDASYTDLLRSQRRLKNPGAERVVTCFHDVKDKHIESGMIIFCALKRGLSVNASVALVDFRHNPLEFKHAEVRTTTGGNGGGNVSMYFCRARQRDKILYFSLLAQRRDKKNLPLLASSANLYVVHIPPSVVNEFPTAEYPYLRSLRGNTLVAIVTPDDLTAAGAATRAGTTGTCYFSINPVPGAKHGKQLPAECIKSWDSQSDVWSTLLPHLGSVAMDLEQGVERAVGQGAERGVRQGTVLTGAASSARLGRRSECFMM